MAEVAARYICILASCLWSFRSQMWGFYAVILSICLSVFAVVKKAYTERRFYQKLSNLDIAVLCY